MTFVPQKFGQLDPYDIIWKNLFDRGSNFNTLEEKVNYPVDLYETDQGLFLELAATGLAKEDIQILVDAGTLRIIYDRGNDEDQNRAYLQKGIARRSIDLTWKISNRFDLSKLEAKLDKGLLTISIPQSTTHKNLSRIEIK